MKKFAALALGLIMALASHITPANASTLQNVITKGYVQCGVHDNLPGFSQQDVDGNYFGIDADLCRSVAAAVFGDTSYLQFTPLKPAEMQSALQNEEVDILASGSWSLANDAQSGTTFVGPMYHDQVAFMLRKSLLIGSANELDGASICFVKGDVSEALTAVFFRANLMTIEPVIYDSFAEAAVAYDAGSCNVLAANQSALHASRTFFQNFDPVIILPEKFGFTMMGPQVRSNDAQWADIVRWTRNALIRAETLNINLANVQYHTQSGSNPEAKRLLGSDGSKLGLAQNRKWAYEAIRQVGNYGEIFDRHIGPDTAIGLDRGMNATVFNGGLMVSPNF